FNTVFFLSECPGSFPGVEIAHVLGKNVQLKKKKSHKNLSVLEADPWRYFNAFKELAIPLLLRGLFVLPSVRCLLSGGAVQVWLFS
ncbi:hypothetical protein ACQP3C_29455, partial [Escherichia coli]